MYGDRCMREMMKEEDAKFLKWVNEAMMEKKAVIDENTPPESGCKPCGEKIAEMRKRYGPDGSGPDRPIRVVDNEPEYVPESHLTKRLADKVAEDTKK